MLERLTKGRQSSSIISRYFTNYRIQCFTLGTSESTKSRPSDEYSTLRIERVNPKCSCELCIS